MPYDSALAERVRQQLIRKPGITEKKMFGGVGFLLRGNMCVGVWKEFLILRLGPTQGDAALELPGVRVFDITGRAMRGWVMVAQEACEDDEQLRDWTAQALKFVRTLPAK